MPAEYLEFAAWGEGRSRKVIARYTAPKRVTDSIEARVRPGAYRVPGVEKDDGNGNVIAEGTGEIVGRINYEDGTVVRPTG